MAGKKYTPEKRLAIFLSKVTVSETSECWNWHGILDKRNYGLFWSGERMMAAHRWSYEHYVGAIPNGLLVCHHCDNPSCVNPKHLFVGTYSDNMQDMLKKGRGRAQRHHDLYPVGENNRAAKLTEADVREIRRRYQQGGVSQSALGSEYSVTQCLIGYIVRGKIWRHLL